MKQLTIDITTQQHQSVEAMAAVEGKSIKDYAIEGLFSAPSEEIRAFGELKALLEERLQQSARDEVLSLSLVEIAEESITHGNQA
jgi:Antitoxin ParD